MLGVPSERRPGQLARPDLLDFLEHSRRVSDGFDPVGARRQDDLSSTHHAGRRHLAAGVEDPERTRDHRPQGLGELFCRARIEGAPTSVDRLASIALLVNLGGCLAIGFSGAAKRAQDAGR